MIKDENGNVIVDNTEECAKRDLTPAQIALLPEWNKRWEFDIIKRVTPQTEEDRRICFEAAHKLYDLGKLKRPNVAFTDSPRRGAVIAAAAVWINYVKTNYPDEVKGLRKIDFSKVTDPTQRALLVCLGEIKEDF